MILETATCTEQDIEVPVEELPRFFNNMHVLRHASTIPAEPAPAGYTGVYEVLYKDKLQSDNMVIGCEYEARYSGQWMDSLRFDDVYAKCEAEHTTASCQCNGQTGTSGSGGTCSTSGQ